MFEHFNINELEQHRSYLLVKYQVYKDQKTAQEIVQVNLELAERELSAMRLRDLQRGSIFRFTENGVRWVVIHVDGGICNQRPIFQIMSENGAFRTTFKVDRGVKPLAVVPYHVQLWSWREWHNKQVKSAK